MQINTELILAFIGVVTIASAVSMVLCHAIFSLVHLVFPSKVEIRVPRASSRRYERAGGTAMISTTPSNQ